MHTIRQFASLQTFIIIGLFVVTGLLVYGHTLHNDFVRFDDGLLIYENKAARGFSWNNIQTAFTTYDPELYIPLTLLSYQLDYELGANNPTVYHLHNLLLHIINVILVYALGMKLAGNRLAGLLAGLLFLVHPLNTEVVAWASARKDVLATTWFLASVLTYTYSNGTHRRWYYLSIACFFISLLAKVTTIFLPAALLCIDFVRRRPVTKQMFIEKIPYAVCSLAFAVIAVAGKTHVLDASTWLEKALVSIKSLWFYIQAFLWPHPLAVLYPLNGDITLWQPRFFVPLLLLSLITYATWRLRKVTPWPLFAFSWFIIAISPTLPNFSKGDFFYLASDRYAYLGLIGVSIGVSTVLVKHILQRQQPILPTVIIGTWLLSFGITAHAQGSRWLNTKTLFAHNIAHFPGAVIAHNNYGNVLTYQQQTPGNTQVALDAYNTAFELTQQYARGAQEHSTLSKILANQASVYRHQGDYVQAQRLYREALYNDPINTNALIGLGILYGQQGQVGYAEQYYKAAISSSPNIVTAYVNLGSLYIQQERHVEALDVLRTATEKNPFYPQAHYNLAVAYCKLNKNRESLEAYEKAVELQPSFVAARINLGIQYAERRRTDDAKQQFEAALQYDPDNTRAQAALERLKDY